MKYELTGRITAINETQTFASGFQKREFIVEETEGKYPQTIKFETVKEGCERLDAYIVGQTVNVCFNLRGSEYNGKHYVSLLAWRIEAKDAPLSPHNVAKGNGYQPQRATAQNGAQPPARVEEGDEDSSIPF